MRKEIFSFDVFDTALVRSVGEPTGAFLLLADRLRDMQLCTLSAANFRRLRIAAERLAHQKNPVDGGPKIDAIYQELAAAIGWNTAQAHQAMQAEREVENSILHAVPCALREISSARKAGAQIVFLSDMYWSSDTIKSFLQAKGIALDEDHVFSSADVGLGKSSGGLYLQALKELGSSEDRMLHIGNSLQADVKGAGRAAVQAEHFPSGNLSTREAILLEDPENLFEQHLSGAARICRLQHAVPGDSTHLNTLTAVASSVVMPVLLSFAIWVVREAQSRKLKRLFFVSRDGWLLKKAVEKALNICRHRVDCVFLYGSRQAWHGAAVRFEEIESCTWLFEGRDTLTLQRLFKRLGLSAVVQNEVAAELGLNLEAGDVLDEEQMCKVIAKIKTAVTGSDRLAAALKERRNSTLAYLRQEGVISESRSAIVDLGWAGRLQDSLNALVEQDKGLALEGLYLGLVKGAGGARHHRAAFLFDHRIMPSELDGVAGLLQILESFSTQRHGSTVGYEKDDNEYWRPVFRVSEDQSLIEWGIDHVHRVCASYLEAIPDACGGESEPPATLVKRANRIITAFVMAPSILEAKHWGAFPFEHEQSGGGRMALASGFDGPLRSLSLLRQNGSTYPLGGYWRQAAIVISPWWCHLLARTLMRMISLLRLRSRP